MSLSIEWLEKLSADDQELVLQQLSNADKLISIEVDGKVYHIPKAVSGLIESLWKQLEDKKTQLSAIKKN